MRINCTLAKCCVTLERLLGHRQSWPCQQAHALHPIGMAMKGSSTVTCHEGDLLTCWYACAGIFGCWASCLVASHSLAWSRESSPLVHQCKIVWSFSSVARPLNRHNLGSQGASPCVLQCVEKKQNSCLQSLYKCCLRSSSCMHTGQPNLQRKPSELIRMWPMG